MTYKYTFNEAEMQTMFNSGYVCGFICGVLATIVVGGIGIYLYLYSQGLVH